MLESLCNMGILPLSLTMGINSVIVSLQFLNGEGVDTKGLMELEQASDLSTAGVLMAALFFLMALARVMRAFRRREKGKAVFVVTLCQACAFAAVGGIALAFGVTVKTIYMAGLVDCVAMGAGRVVSIVRNHTPRNVVLNLICLIFLYFAFRFSTLLAFLIFILAFISIINYLFSRVDLKMLKNIIRTVNGNPRLRFHLPGIAPCKHGGQFHVRVLLYGAFNASAEIAVTVNRNFHNSSLRFICADQIFHTVQPRAARNKELRRGKRAFGKQRAGMRLVF